MEVKCYIISLTTVETKENDETEKDEVLGACEQILV